MKTRHGFVSNSSTSSFFIYGAAIPERQFMDLMVQRQKREESDLNEDEYRDMGAGEMADDLSFVLGKEFLAYVPEGYRDVFIGVSPCSLTREDNVGAWQDRIKKAISDALDTEVEVGWHSGEYPS